MSADEKSKLEDFLVEYHDVFAKHRFDVGYNTELKIKLTPAHQLPVYVQGPPAPIHLRDEILVELALLQCFNIITTLSHSKYSSPIFVLGTVQFVEHSIRRTRITLASNI